MTDNSDLGQLVAQEKELETQRVKLCALSSPIRKATNEVLLQILQDACEANDLYGYFQATKKDIFDGQGSPHAIRDLPTIATSNVCSRWRNLALSSPSLWANLAIRIYTVGAESKEAGKLRFIDKVTRFLERSGEWPLRLSLYLDNLPERAPVPLLNLLAQHARRWKTFEYQGEHSLTFHQMPSHLRFPSLLELRIKGSSDKDDDDFEDGDDDLERGDFGRGDLDLFNYARDWPPLRHLRPVPLSLN
ncbi:hypothetical protein BDP27DRAFT_728135 [Rhodocollybia butyracea]|uniref:F-box domain-containing protein n=1 Tax=Rhodocollybia butyracea TaxID=206335 RepID=A0A9P5TWS5_9AGAR|nr:hypothetical protein BDP27DRAFT_728135 [Rhodocollybia butyracea]